MGGVYHAKVKDTVIRLVEVLETNGGQGTAGLKPTAQANANFAAGPSPCSTWNNGSRYRGRSRGLHSGSSSIYGDSRISDAVAADIIEVKSPSEPR